MIDIKLPEAKNIKPFNKLNQLTITLTNEGLIYLNDKYISSKELETFLTQAYKDEPSTAITIRSDRLVAFKHVVDILDLTTGICFKNVSIAAVKK